VHCDDLDQRLFDRALAPPIALDDRRLERLPAQLRNLSRTSPALVAGAGIATRGAALTALRIAQPIRLGIEQRSTPPPRCPAPSGRGGS